MSLKIYQDLDGRHHWAESTSDHTISQLARGAWVLFDDTPDTPPPPGDPFVTKMAAVAAGDNAFTTAQRAALVPRENLPSVSILDYGAEPGVDSSAAFAAAADALAAATKSGYVDIPSGTWIAEFELRDGITFRGAGTRRTIVTPPAGSASAAQVTIPAGVTQRAGMRDMTLQGNGNAGQKGFYAYARVTDTTSGGLWRSSFENLSIKDFSGGAIHLRGGGIDALKPIQHIEFLNVNAERDAATTAPTVWFTGQVNQTRWLGGNIDGPNGSTATGPNLLIQREINDDGSNLSAKVGHTLFFGQGCSFQNATLGATVETASSVTFDTCHFENLSSGVSADLSASGVRVVRSHFANAASDGLGTGFGVRAWNAYVTVGDNEFIGTTDRTYLRTGTSAGVAHVGYTTKPTGVTTSGLAVTRSVGGDGSIDTSNARVVAVNTSATNITTLTSLLTTGESIHLRANGGSILLATGGNIGLGGKTSPVTVPSGALATLVRFDTGSVWNLVSVSA